MRKKGVSQLERNLDLGDRAGGMHWREQRTLRMGSVRMIDKRQLRFRETKNMAQPIHM